MRITLCIFVRRVKVMINKLKEMTITCKELILVMIIIMTKMIIISNNNSNSNSKKTIQKIKMINKKIMTTNKINQMKITKTNKKKKKKKRIIKINLMMMITINNNNKKVIDVFISIYFKYFIFF